MFSRDIARVVERCELIGLLGNDIAVSASATEARVLTQEILKLANANLDGEDANADGIVGSTSAEFGLRQLRSEFDAMLAREKARLSHDRPMVICSTWCVCPMADGCSTSLVAADRSMATSRQPTVKRTLKSPSVAGHWRGNGVSDDALFSGLRAGTRCGAIVVYCRKQHRRQDGKGDTGGEIPRISMQDCDSRMRCLRRVVTTPPCTHSKRARRCIRAALNYRIACARRVVCKLNRATSQGWNRPGSRRRIQRNQLRCTRLNDM